MCHHSHQQQCPCNWTHFLNFFFVKLCSAMSNIFPQAFHREGNSSHHQEQWLPSFKWTLLLKLLILDWAGLREKLFISYCSKGSCSPVNPELHCAPSCQSIPPQRAWIVSLVQDWDAAAATMRLSQRGQHVGGKSQIRRVEKEAELLGKNKKNFIAELWLGLGGCFYSMCLTCPRHINTSVMSTGQCTVRSGCAPGSSTHLKMPITHAEPLFILP